MLGIPRGSHVRLFIQGVLCVQLAVAVVVGWRIWRIGDTLEEYVPLFGGGSYLGGSILIDALAQWFYITTIAICIQVGLFIAVSTWLETVLRGVLVFFETRIPSAYEQYMRPHLWPTTITWLQDPQTQKALETLQYTAHLYVMVISKVTVFVALVLMIVGVPRSETPVDPIECASFVDNTTSYIAEKFAEYTILKDRAKCERAFKFAVTAVNMT